MKREGGGGGVRTGSTDENGELRAEMPQDPEEEAGNKTTHRSKETSRDTELGERMSTELERITKLAGENRQLKFLSIAHLLTTEALMEAFK
jgi:hypothetical protein